LEALEEDQVRVFVIVLLWEQDRQPGRMEVIPEVQSVSHQEVVAMQEVLAVQAK
jgi:hypothetical protein